MNAPDGLHVGIIMDGNGRWAARQGKGRYAGHRVGARAVRACVRAAPDLRGTRAYAVRILHQQLEPAGTRGAPAAAPVRAPPAQRDRRVRCERSAHPGNRPARPPRREPAYAAIATAERATRGGERLLLRLAIDYSARDAILAAAERIGELTASEEEAPARGVRTVGIEPAVANPCPAGDVDLIIRTGGESRLSDFLLWEGAYAELYFTEVMWPDFGSGELRAAISEFHGRERRFGSVPGRGSLLCGTRRSVPATAPAAGGGRRTGTGGGIAGRRASASECRRLRRIAGGDCTGEVTLKWARAVSRSPAGCSHSTGILTAWMDRQWRPAAARGGRGGVRMVRRAQAVSGERVRPPG